MQAQDFHIKKSITAGGNFVSSTETSIKGARERTVSQTATGNTVTIHQCDLKRTININEQAQTYLIVNDPQDDAALKAAAMMSGAAASESGAYITETSASTDTGERQTMFGYQARHIKTKVTVQSSQNACSPVNQSYELDGWYTDLSKDLASACQQFLPPVRQGEGCSDQVIRKRSGSAKTGYPLTETLTLHNADGSTTQIGVQTSAISKQTLEKELFDIPAGYIEVKTLAELKGGPKPQATPQAAPVTAASMQSPAQPVDQQPTAKGSKKSKLSMAQMMNPAAQLAMQKGMAGQASQTGMGAASSGLSAMMSPGNTPAGMAGMQQQPGATAAAGAPATQPLGPKGKGKIRIGIAPPDAQLGQGNNAGADYSTPIRNAEIALMSGPAIEIVGLDSHIPMQLQAEAQQKQCDYIMYSGVTVKHVQAGGFGKFMKMGSMAANMTPMGAMAHGMGGMVAAQAASQVASQIAQQQAMSQLAGFNGQIKSKDDVAVQYQLVPSGQTTPLVQNSLQGKAKSDGEDVLTPLLTQAATDVLTQVSKK
jgi:hypothetical protein